MTFGADARLSIDSKAGDPIVMYLLLAELW